MEEPDGTLRFGGVGACTVTVLLRQHRLVASNSSNLFSVHRTGCEAAMGHL